MTKTLTLDRATTEQLLSCIYETTCKGWGKRKPNMYVEQRQLRLLSAATCARLLLYPPDDPAFQWLVGEEVQKVFNEHQATEIFNNYRTKLQSHAVNVIGIHFLDKYVGRLSRIWPKYGWVKNDYLPEANQFPFFAKEPGNRTDADYQEHFIYSWLFSHLWMRAYWYELRTTTTLINAFHERILIWNEQPIHFHWESTCPAPNDPKILNQEVCFRENKEFETVREISKEFATIINCHLHNETLFYELKGIFEEKGADAPYTGEYREIVRKLTTEIHEALQNRGILDRFSESALRLRYQSYKDEKVRNWLFNSLRSIAGTIQEIGDMELLWQSSARKSKHLSTEDCWHKSLLEIETLYSSIMSGYSFTGEAGLCFNQVLKPTNDTEAYVIIGFEGNPGSAEHLLKSLLQDLKLLFEITSEMTEKPPQNGRYGHSSMEAVENITKTIPSEFKSIFTPEALGRWLDIVVDLTDQAVHEGSEIQYRLAMGPAFLSRVRGRMFEPAPEFLLVEKVDTESVVHFLKSYYSLFGEKGKICWFNPLGYFSGVFELDNTETAKWTTYIDLSNDAQRFLLASILGHRKFDLLNQNEKVIVRYRKGKISIPTHNNVIEEKVSGLVEMLFDGWSSNGNGRNANHISGLSKIITELVEQLKELGVGTSVVVMRDDDPSSWPKPYKIEETDEPKKLLLSSQCRCLAPKLHRYEGSLFKTYDLTQNPEHTSEFPERIRYLAQKLIPLTKLDGATILRVKDEEIFCNPAMQLIPLIDWGEQFKGKDGTGPIPLDIFNPPEPKDKDEEPVNLPEENPKDKRLSVLQLSRLADLLQGNVSSESDTQKEIDEKWKKGLAFLNSAGTRHHSLWGISITAREPLFTITLSEDGDLRIFCDGRVFLKPTRN